MLRAHFLLAPLKPTQILYIAGREDLDTYGAPNFVADLGHVPRPWTGASMPPGAALTEAGAAAFRRDILSLEVEARLLRAQLYLVAPSDPALASLREPLERVARERQAHFLDLPSDPELAVQMLARAVQDSRSLKRSFGPCADLLDKLIVGVSSA